MKSIYALALLVLVALVALPGATAQALKADIPFAFTVGDTPLPAGEYIVSSPVSGVIRIANTRTHDAATVSTSHAYSDAGRDPRLQFNRYGDRYFLHRVLCPSASAMNVEIPQWKREKKARSMEARLNQGETIQVAANNLPR